MAAESSGTPEVKTIEENTRKRKRLTAVVDKLASQVQVERKQTSGGESTGKSGGQLLSTGTGSDEGGDVSPKIHLGAPTLRGAHSWSSVNESPAPSGDEGSISERSPFSPSGESISSVSDTPAASCGPVEEGGLETREESLKQQTQLEIVTQQSTQPEVFRFDTIASQTFLRRSVSDEEIFALGVSSNKLTTLPPSDNQTPPITEILKELGVRSPRRARHSPPQSTVSVPMEGVSRDAVQPPRVSIQEPEEVRAKVAKEDYFRSAQKLVTPSVFELPRVSKVSKSKSLAVPFKCQRSSSNILTPPLSASCSCPTCLPLISITTVSKPIESHPTMWLEAAAASEQYLAGGVPMSPASPLTPNTPLSPVSHTFLEHYFHSKYFPDLFRRRSHSDGDLQQWSSNTTAIESAEQRNVNTSSSAIVTSSLTAAAILSSTTTTSSSVTRSGRPIPKPLYIPSLRKGGSLESDQSTPQDSPLDLSMKFSSMSRGNSPRRRRRNRRERRSSSISSESSPGTPFLTPVSSESSPFGKGTFELSMVSPRLSPLARGGSGGSVGGDREKTSSSLLSVPMMKGDVTSPTLKESLAVQYNMDVSPVVEEMPPGADVAYVCPVCGQMFSLHDRLAKHMASRHKTRLQSESSAKCYLCEVCKRSFARSDMLTRHMRLHTGHKPYTCQVCGQVFSRSDHLSTHQRTHTGEKPYRCPQCPYAACRRDMITRHMRTHARYDLPEGGGVGGATGAAGGGGVGGQDVLEGDISLPKDLSASATANLSNDEETVDVTGDVIESGNNSQSRNSRSPAKQNSPLAPMTTSVADD